MVSKQLIDSLKSLGLNTLEAEAYCELLLHNNGITAYRLAKSLNKATANVYKSVRVLAEAGGVIFEKTNKELCHAVNPEVFLSSLNMAYNERCAQASKLLHDSHFKESDEGFYRINNANLAIQYAKNAIDTAQASIIIDAFPRVLDNLKEHLKSALERGVKVYLQCYREFKLSGAEIVCLYDADKAIKLWKTEQLNLVIDSKKSLICLFNQDLSEAIQAMWSKDLYLASVLHVGLSREHFFHRLKHLANHIDLPDEISQLLDVQDNFILSATLGKKDLEFLLQSTIPNKTKLNRKLNG